MDGITYPFEWLNSVVIFQPILSDALYLDDWNKSNIVPCHKQESKNLIKNYRPISLFPVFSKVFQRLPITFFKTIL